MQDAVPVGEGSMIAVLGLNIDDIKALIKKNDDKHGACEIANDNADGQIIVSGNTLSVKSLQTNLKENKIKSIPLKVSAPFHCSLMSPAAEKMQEKIMNINFEKPSFEIINNVNANVETDPESIKKLLIQQIYSTVKWRESLINMSKLGIRNFFEIGPGKALTGMVKRTIKNSNCFSINSIADIKNIENEFKK